jgi:hypothetical protein
MKTSMEDPLGVLPTGPTTTTTEFEEDVNGGPTWGVLPVGPVVTSIEFEEDVDDAPLRGAAGPVSLG